MAEIINGKEISQVMRNEIRIESEQFFNKTGIKPGLAVILVGDNSASKIYVKNKKQACLDTGIESYEILMPEDVSETELIDKIEKLNSDSKIHGILVQLPLPPHISEELVISSISPDKDVDCFHPYNVGRLMIGRGVFAPCTPSGIMELLYRYNVRISGKKCVIVGRSNIVGKPMSMLLLAENGTVTVCHSRTEDLKKEISAADIVVVAVGKAGFITGDMLKPGAVVVDVGINRNADGKVIGDVDFESASAAASKITPVPGGVGPMTVTMLMKNTLNAARMLVKH